MPERTAVSSSLRLIVSSFRRIVGMPDYQTYIAHLQQKHPECAVPSEQEYFDQYVTARYSGGPTRCC
jgi:uncharacterized short protein YbdD (DUF466 family)